MLLLNMLILDVHSIIAEDIILLFVGYVNR